MVDCQVNPRRVFPTGKSQTIFEDEGDQNILKTLSIRQRPFGLPKGISGVLTNGRFLEQRDQFFATRKLLNILKSTLSADGRLSTIAALSSSVIMAHTSGKDASQSSQVLELFDRRLTTSRLLRDMSCPVSQYQLRNFTQGHIFVVALHDTLTLGMDVPEMWLVSPVHCKHDLDNIQLASLPATEKNLVATFKLDSILVTGMCVDFSALESGRNAQIHPRGVQLTLGTPDKPAKSDPGDE
eukprot:jgi/Picre1/32502/NNA_007848.t1